MSEVTLELWRKCRHGRRQGHWVPPKEPGCLIPQEHDWCDGAESTVVMGPVPSHNDDLPEEWSAVIDAARSVMETQ